MRPLAEKFYLGSKETKLNISKEGAVWVNIKVLYYKIKIHLEVAASFGRGALGAFCCQRIPTFIHRPILWAKDDPSLTLDWYDVFDVTLDVSLKSTAPPRGISSCNFLIINWLWPLARNKSKLKLTKLKFSNLWTHNQWPTDRKDRPVMVREYCQEPNLLYIAQWDRLIWLFLHSRPRLSLEWFYNLLL